MGKFNLRACTNICYMISDLLFVMLSFFLAALLAQTSLSKFYQMYFGIGLSCFVIYLLSGITMGLYNITSCFYLENFFEKVTKSFVITLVILLLQALSNHALLKELNAMILFLVMSYFSLFISGYLEHFYFRYGNARQRRTVIIGEKTLYDKFVQYLDQSNLGYDVVGFVALDKKRSGYLGTLANLDEILHVYAIDQICLAESLKSRVDLMEILNRCIEMGVTVKVIDDVYQNFEAKKYVSSLGSYPVVTYHTVILNLPEQFFKRVIDIIGALFGIILFSPIMLVTAIAIKLDSKGPIIFKQKRVGLNGRIFHMYKFRSMCIDAEEKKKELMKYNEMKNECMFKIKDDPRITKVGKFIRKTSIDEIPQFFNVLLGDMSIVGTRPPTLDEVKYYKRAHWRRMSIRPGVTGMWQVSGRSSVTDFDKIVEMDIAYIDKWNVFTDFIIIFKTAYQLIRRKGAF